MSVPPVIAIDGPSASGKGTLARRLAAALNYAHLDSGLLYRAVAAKLLACGRHPGDTAAAVTAARSLTPEDLRRPDLRGEAVGAGASVAAAQQAVRDELVGFQRDFAAAPPDGKAGAVVDGRDIGSVIFPAAPVKFFVTADTRTRAARRHRELIERGEESIYARVLQDMQERDARDEKRAAAPLKAAKDAVVLDTSALSEEQVFEAAIQIVRDRLTP
ncbi:MAG: (d)CMP kinase [Rhodovibrionaceae bacterium]